MNYSNKALFESIQNLTNQYNHKLELELIQSDMRGWALSHASILEILLNENSIGMQELAQKIHRDKSTLTVLINKLERKGYLTRNKSKNDKRNTIIQPTAISIQLLSRIRLCQKKVEQRLITDLDTKDKKILFALMKKISN